MLYLENYFNKAVQSFRENIIYLKDDWIKYHYAPLEEYFTLCFLLKQYIEVKKIAIVKIARALQKYEWTLFS